MKTIIALIGKAGSGKDRILNEIYNRHKEFNKIINCTTRPKREKEIQGIHYYFLNEQEFIQKIINKDMLNVTEFREWLYGVTKSSLKDGINIGIFNPEAYYEIKESLEKDIQIIGIYICCNSKTRLLRQLNREENPDVNEIVRRYTTDEKDFCEIDIDNALQRIKNEEIKDIPYVVSQIESIINKLGISS